MEQYFSMKAKHPDAIMLFRVGDFYETFGEDAIKVADILGIVLTSRNNGGSDIELAGFPYHSLDVYLPKLVRAGFRVAICEQLEKPGQDKKLVKRGITELITPGITIEDTLLDKRSNNYLASLHFESKDEIGIAFIEISTGEFLVSEGNHAAIEKLLYNFSPSEVIYDKSRKKYAHKLVSDQFFSYVQEEWIYTPEYTISKLLEHFKVSNLKGFGVEHLEIGKMAAGAALHYLQSTHNDKLSHISRISRIQSDQYIWLDRFTVRNLELVQSIHEGGKSLLEVLDKTVTPMGSRLLKKWLLMPLLDIDKIRNRHNAIEVLITYDDMRNFIYKQIKKIGDLERLCSKLAMEKISPREVWHLLKALEAIQPVKKVLMESSEPGLTTTGEKLHHCQTPIELIRKSIHEEAPNHVSKGNTIKDGYNDELDELRNIIKNSKELLLEIQQNEALTTGITNLKIGFNNVFGYYLEVTNKYKNQGLIPDNWVRKQTLTGAERYITDELKKLETKILTAEDKILALEEHLYAGILARLNEFLSEMQHNAQIIAWLDCLYALSEAAIKYQYCKPIVNESKVIDILEGRHPVIEQQLPPGEAYVPNDVFMDDTALQIMMITGPNMSGKSALLRQTALIVLMAQIGSYVPARSATIGVVDKIFTRVGASDNISSGESTFMLEMNETASIMNNLSDRSLILLDEIGRGTSTYDGISIAWSLAEYLHNHSQAKPKTLFATHYHELNELALKYKRIKNYNVATREINNKVIFLRKLEEGGCHHSFGIHVAQMAGMPVEIISRAQEILSEMEKKSIENPDSNFKKKNTQSLQTANPVPQYQMSIFETHDPRAGKIIRNVQSLQINNMTPIECMLKLKELIDLAEEDIE